MRVTSEDSNSFCYLRPFITPFKSVSRRQPKPGSPRLPKPVSQPAVNQHLVRPPKSSQLLCSQRKAHPSRSGPMMRLLTVCPAFKAPGTHQNDCSVPILERTFVAQTTLSLVRENPSVMFGLSGPRTHIKWLPERIISSPHFLTSFGKPLKSFPQFLPF